MRRIFGSETSYQYTLCARAEWLRKNQEAARRVAAAIVRTLRWMREHSPEEVREKLPEASRTADLESDLEGLRIALPFFSKDGVISAEAVVAAREAAAASLPKIRTANIDLSQTFTNELVREK
jgi:NitT/TauT family transport system substrate-binding protein